MALLLASTHTLQGGHTTIDQDDPTSCRTLRLPAEETACSLQGGEGFPLL
jgi:hypothetical protein